MAAAAAALLAAVHAVFVRADLGRWYDDAYVDGRVAFPPVWLRDDVAPRVTDACVALLAAGAGASLLAALARGRRAAAAVAAAYVAVVVLSARVLKALLPGGGVPLPPSLPSGHTATAVALAAAALALAPPRARAPAGVAGGLLAGLVGLGVVMSGAHRPSDVPAAGLLCLAWAGLLVAALRLAGAPEASPRERPPWAAIAAAALLALPSLAALAAFAAAEAAGVGLPEGTPDAGFYAVAWPIAATAPAAAAAAIACLAPRAR